MCSVLLFAELLLMTVLDAAKAVAVNNPKSLCSFKNESGLGTNVYPFITELSTLSIQNEQVLVLETPASQSSLKSSPLFVCQDRQHFKEKLPDWLKTLY